VKLSISVNVDQQCEPLRKIPARVVGIDL